MPFSHFFQEVKRKEINMLTKTDISPSEMIMYHCWRGLFYKSQRKQMKKCNYKYMGDYSFFNSFL